MENNSGKRSVGYFCSSNPFDKKSWSGIHYNLYKAIENEGFEMINLSPVIYNKYYGFILKYYHKIHRIFSKRALNDEYSLLNAFFSKRYFNSVLKSNTNIDFIFAPAATTQVALLNTSIPIIYFNDTTHNQLKEYYKYLSYGSKWSIAEGNMVQKLTLKKASKIIFPTAWAKDYAVAYYGINANKIAIGKMGANIEVPSTIVERNFSNEITFLFLGVNWERKGGEIVFETLQLLENNGYKVKLIVCGCKPPVTSHFIQYEGFLDKNKEEDALKLKHFLNTSHFLFVPTRAECYGIVFCEASAYGLISITTATGGVSAIIKNGINGFALPIEAKSNDYFKVIFEALKNPENLKKMSLLCRNEYNTYLSWNNFGKIFSAVCNEIENTK